MTDPSAATPDSPAPDPRDTAVRDAFLDALGWPSAHEYVNRGMPAHGPAADRDRVVELASQLGVTVAATSTRYRADLEHGTARWSTWSLYPREHVLTALAVTLTAWQSDLETGTGAYWGCRDVSELATAVALDDSADADTDSPTRRLRRQVNTLLTQGPYGSTVTVQDRATQTLAALLGDTLAMSSTVSSLTVTRISRPVIANAGLLHTARALAGTTPSAPTVDR